MAVLRQAGRPLGAYEIAARSRATATPLAANQVYRILDRLAARGDVRRVALLSAYMAAGGERLGVAVCRRCGAVARFDSAPWEAAIAAICNTAGFSPSAPTIEVSGLCAECAD
ncbi:MAG TPA: transcriptional repressor [Sphingopyxis sp.]|nr:transcriptional repressor [Sphingopyxis sp.]HMP43752.1 transcriptional repressor [Sphingopyxis sp.]HMQ17547.1 transcriptional repressor [Sphingopyxis sp.]